jgi:hypothetical protein
MTLSIPMVARVGVVVMVAPAAGREAVEEWAASVEWRAAVALVLAVLAVWRAAAAWVALVELASGAPAGSAV